MPKFFRVSFPEYDDHEMRVNAFNEQDAAEKAVATFERKNVEFPVASGLEAMKVVVHCQVSNTTFEVRGQSVPRYYATKKD